MTRVTIRVRVNVRQPSKWHDICDRTCELLTAPKNYISIKMHTRRSLFKFYTMHFMAKICFHIYNATQFISKETKFFVSGKNSYFPSIFDAVGHFIELCYVCVAISTQLESRNINVSVTLDVCLEQIKTKIVSSHLDTRYALLYRKRD